MDFLTIAIFAFSAWFALTTIAILVQGAWIIVMHGIFAPIAQPLCAWFMRLPRVVRILATVLFYGWIVWATSIHHPNLACWMVVALVLLLLSMRDENIKKREADKRKGN